MPLTKTKMMLAQQLKQRAIEAWPNEACGFILKDGSIVDIPNVAARKSSQFLMSISDLMGVNPDDVQDIWHTHPRGTLYPSLRDREAIECGAIQPHWGYIIATRDSVVRWPTSLEAIG